MSWFFAFIYKLKQKSGNITIFLLSQIAKSVDINHVGWYINLVHLSYPLRLTELLKRDLTWCWNIMWGLFLLSQFYSIVASLCKHVNMLLFIEWMYTIYCCFLDIFNMQAVQIFYILLFSILVLISSTKADTVVAGHISDGAFLQLRVCSMSFCLAIANACFSSPNRHSFE